ncbi:MAG: 30S ribosomal protein S12 methylthiotransferase RimO [Pseudomonadota bacterium]
MRLFAVSLGCPKNRVDTEVLLGLATREGHEVVSEPATADAIVVNTCGFIADAKKESIDTILEMAGFKAKGTCSLLIVTGCLVQRHAEELAAELPEVDFFLGVDEIGDIVDILAPSLGRIHQQPRLVRPRVRVTASPCLLVDASAPRLIPPGSATAFVKIAEGCDRPCAFCVIPQIRGRQRSRPIDDVVREAEALAGSGIREIILVAQDTTAYGSDSPSGALELAKLLVRLDRARGLRWIRLLYAYPTEVTDELIDAIAGLSRVVKYLDVPLQHVDDRVLKAMRRGYSGAFARKLVDKLRARVPGLVLRTTFLVGHPGETTAAFERLRSFVAEAELDRVGVFAFSPEEGTASALLPDRIPAKVARQRSRALMRLQQGISRRRQQLLVGRTIEVLVEGVAEESELLLVGRSAGQAPEIDGVVYLTDGTAAPGEIVRARVTQAAEYDLVASISGD